MLLSYRLLRFRFVAEGGLLASLVFLLGVLNTEKALSRLRREKAFLFLSLAVCRRCMQRLHARAINKKALPINRQGFFGVAEGGFEPPTFGL